MTELTLTQLPWALMGLEEPCKGIPVDATGYHPAMHNSNCCGGSTRIPLLPGVAVDCPGGHGAPSEEVIGVPGGWYPVVQRLIVSWFDMSSSVLSPGVILSSVPSKSMALLNFPELLYMGQAVDEQDALFPAREKSSKFVPLCSPASD